MNVLLSRGQSFRLHIFLDTTIPLTLCLLVPNLPFVSSRIHYTCRKPLIFSSSCRNKLQKMCEAAAQLGLFGLHCLDTGSQILWLDSFLWRKVQNLTSCLVMCQISAMPAHHWYIMLVLFWPIQGMLVWSCLLMQNRAKAYTRKWIHLSHLFMKCFFTRTKIPITSQPVGRLKWYMTYLSPTLEISKGRF